MDLFETSVKVIFFSIFAHIAETKGLPFLLSMVNNVISKFGSKIPETIATTINRNFGLKYDALKSEVKDILSKIDVSELPQLQYFDPSFKEVIKGPSPRCIGSLVMGVKVNTDLTSGLLTLCDGCLRPTECLTCLIMIFKSGSKLETHRASYAGMVTYFLVLEGSHLAHMKIGDRNFTMMAKSSILFDPMSPTSIENTGPSDLIFIRLDLYRPLEHNLDHINSVAIQIAGETAEVQQICKMITL